MDNEERIKKARERAQAKVDFFGHLIIYIVVNSGIVALNLLTTPNNFWAIFPIVGWGIGLGSHFASVFIFDNIFKNYVENEVRKEMNKNP